jgi:hypothetical protein
MPALASDLRRRLENVCVQARELAEAAARSALQKRAVDAAEPFAHFSAAEKELRTRLRARGRQVGDVRHANKTQAIDQLTQELAYEYWHRMLFARFLAENHLLMHPDGVAVSLEECDELAKSEGAPNGFVLAARYASRMLPQVFRTDDVLLEIEFAPEQRIALEKLLASLPRETFVADDGLGWVYQFWQTKRKDDVNKSGEKIDGRTLPAVTQLFTEDYMVQFLLHNTIGAWWCARHGVGQAFQPDLLHPVRLESLIYLRWREDGTPAAGTFEGWPKTLKEFTLLDPCCGSGHFLVAAFQLLVPLRMRDEGLSAKEAAEAVLRDNLFGLELDPRCTQIAAFALALAAWKYPSKNGEPLGYRPLPPLNIACTGIGPQATEEQWLKLAEESSKRMSVLAREPIRNGLLNLHALFSDAPTLGSLIDPNQLSADMLTADYETLKPYLDAALTAEQTDEEARERAVAAAGMVKAAELLAREYTLVATNVPYLGRGKQHDALKRYCEKNYADAKADLATCFVERCLAFCAAGGTAALVTPQNWLFLATYKKMREILLKRQEWNLVARLGPRAFGTISGEVVNVALVVFSDVEQADTAAMAGIDVSDAKTAADKATRLTDRDHTPLHVVLQADQLRNPVARISLDRLKTVATLKDFCGVFEGSGRGDTERFDRCFWELSQIDFNLWKPLVNAPERTDHYAGREMVFLWENGQGQLAETTSVRIRGTSAWGKPGVFVARAGEIKATLTLGVPHAQNGVAIVPGNEEHLVALWAYCSSSDYRDAVRKISGKVIVPSSALWGVPFDLTHWQAVAQEKYPNGFPEPRSDDPTQWLFQGSIASSTDPLQVAIVRLLNYRWPEQSKESDGVDALADKDGIVCIPAVRGAPPASERLLEVLHAAYGKKWSNAVLHDLLTAAGCKAGTSLDDWLRNAFFEQHCKRFHQRPFIWHIWDGRKDGFSCLVNYHKLDHVRLESLTYSYLGDWINGQNADAKAGKIGADLRLAAAQALQEKLKLILAGEPPYDIFVLRSLEAAVRTSHRLEPRPERRRAHEHPPVCRGRHSAEDAEHQVDEGPRQGTGAGQGRIPLVLEGPGVHR